VEHGARSIRGGPAVKDRVYVVGQSIASRFLNQGADRFKAHIAARAPEYADLRLLGSVHGGSLSSSANSFKRRNGGPPRKLWWDAEAGQPGEPLVQALAKIAGFGPGPWRALVFDLGQHEAALKSLKGVGDTAQIRANYAAAVREILALLRRALCPEAPESLPVLFAPVGPLIVSDTPRPSEVGAFRAMQYDLIAELPECHAIPGLLEMELSDWAHPSEAGIDFYARQVAREYVALRRRDIRAFPQSATAD